MGLLAQRFSGVKVAIAREGHDPRHSAPPPPSGSARQTRAARSAPASRSPEHGGAKLADLDMIQFHPTALVHDDPQHDGFLITEAIRGEGAHLLDSKPGERFVDELAPRDQVALAVQGVLTEGERVYLDMRSIDMRGFPNVAAALRRAMLDEPKANYGDAIILSPLYN